MPPESGGGRSFKTGFWSTQRQTKLDAPFLNQDGVEWTWLNSGLFCYKGLGSLRVNLNQSVAATIEKGEPVTAPGVPKNYPDATKLVTEGCIKPAKR